MTVRRGQRVRRNARLKPHLPCCKRNLVRRGNGWARSIFSKLLVTPLHYHSLRSIVKIMVFTMQKPNVCTSRKFAILVVFTFAPSKQKNKTVQQTKCRIWDMKGGNVQRSSPRFRTVQFFLCEIFGKTDLPKFIQLCMETPCWCLSGWAAHIAAGN